MPAEKTVSAKALRPERAWVCSRSRREVSVARHRLWEQVADGESVRRLSWREIAGARSHGMH